MANPIIRSFVHEAAYNYATNFGFAVFPCVPKEKRPLTKNGCKDATTDTSKIAEWFEQRPDANLAIACGAISRNLIVLDIDGECGKNSIGEIENKFGPIGPTPKVLTGNGEQLYFISPIPFKNRVRFAPGLDIRSDGGYVIAGPSIHPNGKTYCWERNRELDRLPVAQLPQWLGDLLQEVRSSNLQSQNRNWKEEITQVKTGSRNQTLASISGHLFRRGVDLDLAYNLLVAWNQTQTDFPLSPSEFNRTINSIAGAELKRRKLMAGQNGKQ